MTQKTFDLYRCSPSVWADKPWKVALQLRIGAAYHAMDYYREAARSMDSFLGEDYNELMRLFAESEKAVKFNQKLLKECYEAKS